MLKKLSISAAILAATSSVAFATVGGPYVGANIGVNNTKSTLSNSSTDAVSSNSSSIDIGARGASIGAFGGYGTLVNQNVYLGGEVFANYTNAQAEAKSSSTDALGTSQVKSTLRNKYSYGLSFIPGFMVTDHTMAFARAGIVRTRFENKFSESSTTPGSTATSESVQKTVTGGQLGAGLQTELTQNLSLRGEYVYTAYRSFNGTKFDGKVKPSTDQFNVGLVYKFE